MVTDKLNLKTKTSIKIKDKFFIITLFLLFTYIGNAQISLSGKVITSENKPLELAEVVLLTKDSVAIKSELTDDNGFFNLKANPGKYKIQIRQIGKLLFFKEIEVEKDTDLGDIIIVLNDNVLKEITVVARKKLIERKVDRLVFNVENSISAAGGDALDALKVTPGVRVQNDVISMIGKNGMKVMVDDKIIQLSGDDLMFFLKTIASDNIKNIEVITAPPSKYDAEGNSGLINIKLKKNKKDGWNATIKAAIKQASYLNSTTGVNFSYQKNKLELLLDFSSQNGKSIYTNKIFYEYPTEQWKNEIQNTTLSNAINPLMSINYKITNKTKIGLQYIGNYNKPKIDENSMSNIYDKQTSFINTLLKTNGNTTRNSINNSINLNSITEIDTLGKKISIDIDSFTYDSEKKNNFNSETTNYLYDNINTGDTDNSNKQLMKNFSTQINFEMPYKWAKLNYGAKISATKTNNDVKTSIYNTTGGDFSLDSNQTNIYQYKENVQALYFSSDKAINTKWQAKVGLRIEFTQTTIFSQTINETNKTNYYKLFPTGYLTYRPNDKNTYNINFSRRIQRPSYSELNPAKWYFNSNSFEVGNPFLQPSFSTNLELSHSYKDIFTTTIYYSYITNQFGQIVVHDISNNFQKFIRQNYFDPTYFGMQEYINFSVLKNCTTTFSADITYNESKTYTEYLNPNYSGWGGTFSTTNTVILNTPKTLIIAINYSYNTTSKWSESISSTSSNINIGLKYLLLDKKMQLSLFANDLFNSETNTISSKSGAVTGNFKQFYDSPFVRLSISYKIGNGTKNVEKKELGNQEEKNRI